MDIGKLKEVGLQYQDMIAKDVQKRIYFQIKMKPITKRKRNHNMKVVGFVFGGFNANIFKIMQCKKCRKYSWKEIEHSEKVRKKCGERL